MHDRMVGNGVGRDSTCGLVHATGYRPRLNLRRRAEIGATVRIVDVLLGA
jgi:hypothetical protein